MDGLSNGLAKGLDQIESFADDAKKEIINASNEINSASTSSIGRMTNAFGQAAEAIVDNSNRAAGELNKVGGATSRLSGEFMKLGPSVGEGVKHMSQVTLIAGAAADAVAGLNAGAEVLGQTFPKVGAVVSRAMKVAWTAITGPIGIAAAALTGLATLIAFNFDKSVKVITKLTNWFIALYNESIPLRIVVETLVLSFKSLFEIGRAGIRIFKTLGRAMRDAWKAIVDLDFSGVGDAFKTAANEITAIGVDTGQAFTENLAESIKNGFQGREFVTEDDVAGALRPLEKIKDKIVDFFSPDPEAVKGAVSDALIALEEDPLQIPTVLEDPLEDLTGLDFELDPVEPAEIIDERAFDRMFAKLGKSLKDNILSAGISSAIDNVFGAFSAVDNERIKELNDEIRANQELLADTSASREEREAARERIALIEQEIEAEKAKGDIVTQVTATVIDAAEQAIKAALARAIANVIAGEATKGLFGILAAGAAVIAVKQLFKSSVPSLAEGGIATGRSLVEVGEYGNVGIDPEVITPLSKLPGMIRKAMPELARTSAQPVIVGGTINTTVRGRDLYQMLILQHEDYKRTTGINPFT